MSMSFAPPPLSVPGSAAASMATSAAMRGMVPSLAGGAKILGAIFGAGALVATQQLAYEEGRSLINGLRDRSRERRDRNGMIILALAASMLPITLQDDLRRSRDVYAASMKMLTNAKIDATHRDILRDTLTGLLTRH